MRTDQIKVKLNEMNNRLVTIKREYDARFNTVIRRLDDLLEMLPKPKGMVIISDAEQKTLKRLYVRNSISEEWVTATDISLETGRARAVESAHLNDLVRKGIAMRKPVGRQVLFRLKEEEIAELASQE